MTVAKLYYSGTVLLKSPMRNTYVRVSFKIRLLKMRAVVPNENSVSDGRCETKWVSQPYSFTLETDVLAYSRFPDNTR